MSQSMVKYQHSKNQDSNQIHISPFPKADNLIGHDALPTGHALHTQYSAAAAVTWGSNHVNKWMAMRIDLHRVREKLNKKGLTLDS